YVGDSLRNRKEVALKALYGGGGSSSTDEAVVAEMKVVEIVESVDIKKEMQLNPELDRNIEKLADLSKESEKAGLQMNPTKTKAKTNDIETPIMIDGTHIQYCKQ
ncbi:hypothetical protein ANN_13210, partial [Periplaneta americana]